ncbi:folylpolyglutamate synthase-like isoform X1 [Musa acuminata AAA Group]|uniref:folylpolyglutamate synthase-like isoform X1 n=1 Tax=Musa acuminata AAA Group TaxID=214697 RepID=UPI0031E45A90
MPAVATAFAVSPTAPNRCPPHIPYPGLTTTRRPVDSPPTPISRPSSPSPFFYLSLKGRSLLALVCFRLPSRRRLPTEMESNGVLSGKTPDLVLSSSYEAAMRALSSLISGRKRGEPPKRDKKLDLIFNYLKIIGVEKSLPELKIIHIGGTKGKGSTCTFCEAILRECGFRTGLFTSPHLMDVRERFRINGLDISEDKFLYYFWDCWNLLKESVDEDLPMPPLFQFLTVLAFKIFVSEKVDVAIIEVGLGGRFDSTNVVKEPVVCGITSLGMDHMEILGDTIGQIASAKAGIFKPHVPAFTVPQLPEAKLALEERASELMIPLTFAPPLDPSVMNGLTLGLAGDHQLINAGLAVALCTSWLQRTGHAELTPNDNPEEGLPVGFLRGLSTARLGGRAQTIIDKPKMLEQIPYGNSGDLIFYLDGAHSPESMEVCARWFSSAVGEAQQFVKNGFVKELGYSSLYENKHSSESKKASKKILLFNCMEKRDPQLLLPPLVDICASNGVHFSKALFVPSMSVYHRVDSGSSIVAPNTPANLSWQSTLQRTWDKLIQEKDLVNDNGSKMQKLGKTHEDVTGEPQEKCVPVLKDLSPSAVVPSLPLAIRWLRDYAKDNPSLHLQVLVTGSLHLVGDVLKLLRR